MSCSFGSRIWKKLKREVGRVTDDVMLLSCDFKYDFLKVRPDVFEPRVVDRQTFKKEVPNKDPPRSKHKPTAVPMQDVYADTPPPASNGQVPLMMMWPADEEFVPPGVMPAADLGDFGGHSSDGTVIQDMDIKGPVERMPKPPTMGVSEEITVLSSGVEPMGTTSAPMGYESPYIKALMADTSTEAIRSDGYVLDFDHFWDEEDEEVQEVPAETGEIVKEPNLVVFDLSEPAEAQKPNFVVFDLSEPTEEKVPTPNFILIDDSEPAEVQKPNFVVFDLSEPTEEKVPTPNFILIDDSEETSISVSEEADCMMEIAIPEILSDVREMEDAVSEGVFPDDDTNLVPMLDEDHRAAEAEPPAELLNPAALQVTEQRKELHISEGMEVSFGFLFGTSEKGGDSGIDFLFGEEECQDSPTQNYEARTVRDAVKVSSVQTQRLYL